MKPLFVAVDFETYYDAEVTVKKLGFRKYARHPRTVPYLLAIAYGDGRPSELFRGAEAVRQAVRSREALWQADTVVWSANANFDRAVWEACLGAASTLTWRDVLDLCTGNQYPHSLKNAAAAALNETVSKEIRTAMKGRVFEELDEDERRQVCEYCLRDAEIALYLVQKLHGTLSPLESWLSEHTQRINRDGVFVDTDLLEADINALKERIWQLKQAIPWVQDDPDKPALSHKELALWCRKHNLPVPASIAKNNEDVLELMAQYPELNGVISRIRELRRLNVVLRKAEVLAQFTDDTGNAVLGFQYCAALHTRRWSSHGFNIQNLSRETYQVLNREVYPRHWIVPRPGYRFVIADFSQIEPRCLNWLAGNKELLELMARGYNYYEAYATFAHKWRGEPGALKKSMNINEYTRLKSEALGLGYGMGAKKFAKTAKVDFDEAQAIVKRYRATFAKIPAYWERLDRAIRQAALHPEIPLAVRMPTGEYLRHYYVRQTTNAFGESCYHGYVANNFFDPMYEQSRLWGGVLCENITQRMARDVMADVIRRVEQAGIPVRFHVHDELVAEVPADRADEARQVVQERMTQPIEWAPGLPLACECRIAERFEK